MKLVVDANILFAALIKDGKTAELLINDKLKLIAPEFLLEEFAKYKNLILKKTHRSREDFNQYLKFLKDLISFIPRNEISPFLYEAQEISPDPKDTVYLALALAVNSHIWSNDKHLKSTQKKIKVYSTLDLIELLPVLKK